MKTFTAAIRVPERTVNLKPKAAVYLITPSEGAPFIAEQKALSAEVVRCETVVSAMQGRIAEIKLVLDAIGKVKP